MRFSETFVESVRQRSDILEIVSAYVKVTKKGHNYMGLCPFHPEKTPSFCVYHDTNSFYCFGCGAGGDVINFIMRSEKLQYREAVEFLANKLGIRLPMFEEEDEGFLDRKTIFAMNRLSAKFFHSCLMENSKNSAISYLFARGLLKKTLVRFGLGYSRSDGYSLVNYLKKNGFPEEKIEKANLGVRTRSNFLRDRFVNRVMFPIIDVKGNVVGFGARSLENKFPKYLNTAETLVFNKSEHLFALNFAKNEKYFILTEGYMDAVSLYQSGFRSAVASLGTSLTHGQAKLMSRYTDTVYVCYDSDSAGKKATKRALEILNNQNLNVKVIEIENAKDPDEFVRINKENSSSKFKFLLKSSKNSIEFKISELENKFDVNKIEEKISFLRELSKIFSGIRDPIERDVYSSKVCSKYGILKSAFDLKVKKNLQKNEKTQLLNAQKYRKTSKSVGLYVEEFLISCIIRNNDFMGYFDDFSEKDFEGKISSRLFGKIRELLVCGEKTSFGLLSEGFEQKDVGEVSRILNLSYAYDISKSEFLKYFKIFQNKNKLKNFKSSESLESNEILEFLDKLKRDKV